MALFVITGALSLTAGMGIGALIDCPSKNRKSTGHTHRVNPSKDMVPQRVPVPPVAKGAKAPPGTPSPDKLPGLKGGATLDFTDFDKSLLNMVKNKSMHLSQPSVAPPAPPVVTLRQSVVLQPGYYSPPSELPAGVVGTAAPPPIQVQEQPQQPQQPLRGGGTKFTTSWF